MSACATRGGIQRSRNDGQPMTPPGLASPGATRDPRSAVPGAAFARRPIIISRQDGLRLFVVPYLTNHAERRPRIEKHLIHDERVEQGGLIHKRDESRLTV